MNEQDPYFAAKAEVALNDLSKEFELFKQAHLQAEQLRKSRALRTLLLAGKKEEEQLAKKREL